MLCSLSLGPLQCPPTASNSLAAERHGDCVRESWFVVFVVQRIDRYSYICVYLVVLLYQALLRYVFTCFKINAILFDWRIRWAGWLDFDPKSDLGHQILKADFIPSDFAISNSIRRPIYLVSERNVKIYSSESDRVRIILILMSQL